MGLALQASQTKDSVTSPSIHGVLGLTLNPAWVGKVRNPVPNPPDRASNVLVL